MGGGDCETGEFRDFDSERNRFAVILADLGYPIETVWAVLESQAWCLREQWRKRRERNHSGQFVPMIIRRHWALEGVADVFRKSWSKRSVLVAQAFSKQKPPRSGIAWRNVGPSLAVRAQEW